MLADLIPNSVTMENGTDPENIGIPVAAMLNSRDSETLRKLILETKQKVLIYIQPDSIIHYTILQIFLADFCYVKTFHSEYRDFQSYANSRYIHQKKEILMPVCLLSCQWLCLQLPWDHFGLDTLNMSCKQISDEKILNIALRMNKVRNVQFTQS